MVSSPLSIFHPPDIFNPSEFNLEVDRILLSVHRSYGVLFTRLTASLSIIRDVYRHPRTHQPFHAARLIQVCRPLLSPQRACIACFPTGRFLLLVVLWAPNHRLFATVQFKKTIHLVIGEDGTIHGTYHRLTPICMHPLLPVPHTFSS